MTQCLKYPTAFLMTFLSFGCAEKIDTPAEYVEVARKHERDSQPARAVVAYEQALKLAPESATIWYDLGVSYEQLNQLQQAQNAYGNAIKYDTELAEAYNNRAVVYARLKRYDDAIQDCNVAIQLNPGDPFAWRNRGLAHHDMEKTDLAIADYDQAIGLDNRNTVTYLYRGNAYLEREETVRALQDFDYALQLDPKFGTVMVSKAKALSRLDRLEEARQWLAKAESIGIDIGDVELASISEAPAPMPESEESDGDDLIQIAMEYLAGRGIHPSTASLPEGCDLFHSDSQIAYVIRRLNQDQRIIVSDDQLSALQRCKSSISLLVITQDGEPTVTSLIQKWKPERHQMKPHSWAIDLDSSEQISVVPSGTNVHSVSR